MPTPEPQWSEEERELRIGWEVSPQLRSGLRFEDAKNDEATYKALRLAGRATIQKEQHHERRTDAGDRSDTPAKHTTWQPYAE